MTEKKEKTPIETVESYDDRWYKIELSKPEIDYLLQCHPDKEFPDLPIVYFPSVTTQLQAKNESFIATWKGDVGNEVANYRLRLAGVEGTIVHEGVTALQNGNILSLADYEQHEWLQLLKFQQVFKDFRPTGIETEKKVYSLNHLSAGELDWSWTLEEGDYSVGLQKPVHFNAGRYLWDLKTGKGVYSKALYQISAYVKFEEEMNADLNYEGACILHTKAQTNSGYKIIVLNREQIEHYFNLFRATKAIWVDENKSKKPETFDMPVKINLFKEEAI